MNKFARRSSKSSDMNENYQHSEYKKRQNKKRETKNSSTKKHTRHSYEFPTILWICIIDKINLEISCLIFAVRYKIPFCRFCIYFIIAGYWQVHTHRFGYIVFDFVMYFGSAFARLTSSSYRSYIHREYSLSHNQLPSRKTEEKLLN